MLTEVNKRSTSVFDLFPGTPEDAPALGALAAHASQVRSHHPTACRIPEAC